MNEASRCPYPYSGSRQSIPSRSAAWSAIASVKPSSPSRSSRSSGPKVIEAVAELVADLPETAIQKAHGPLVDVVRNALGRVRQFPPIHAIVSASPLSEMPLQIASSKYLASRNATMNWGTEPWHEASKS